MGGGASVLTPAAAVVRASAACTAAGAALYTHRAWHDLEEHMSLINRRMGVRLRANETAEPDQLGVDLSDLAVWLR